MFSFLILVLRDYRKYNAYAILICFLIEIFKNIIREFVNLQFNI